MTIKALIAEDEPLLAQSLQHELTQLWPELAFVKTVGNGRDAVTVALASAPAVLFLDIHMPGLSGLEAAADLADTWPPAGHPLQPFPLLVFVTAFDQHAVAAFDAQAVDYVLKPWTSPRLAQTVERLKARLGNGVVEQAHFLSQARLDRAIDLLRPLLGGAQAHGAGALTTLAASAGQALHYVPVAKVLAFQAADKYVRVITAQGEYLIRTPLKELMPQLPPDTFGQIHRATLVRADALDKVVRDERGRLLAHLHGLSEIFAISRLFASRFKAM
jgi:DNA-binding LytR/AlgR family response regulator